MTCTQAANAVSVFLASVRTACSRPQRPLERGDLGWPRRSRGEGGLVIALRTPSPSSTLHESINNQALYIRRCRQSALEHQQHLLDLVCDDANPPKVADIVREVLIWAHHEHEVTRHPQSCRNLRYHRRRESPLHQHQVHHHLGQHKRLKSDCAGALVEARTHTRAA
jgi:hypothetical protein